VRVFSATEKPFADREQNNFSSKVFYFHHIFFSLALTKLHLLNVFYIRQVSLNQTENSTNKLNCCLLMARFYLAKPSAQNMALVKLD